MEATSILAYGFCQKYFFSLSALDNIVLFGNRHCFFFFFGSSSILYITFMFYHI